ncbi:MAG TPA: hypothetical protein VEB59_01070, partial [Gemmatimonadales bacterium]|nr:hypothetical protein [Gemmatimonadales bacterium]
WRQAFIMAGVFVIGGVAAAAAYRMVHQTPTPAPQPRIVVGAFANRTGDSQFDHLGFMAADWVIEGLQRTGEVEVVPTLTAMAAMRYLRRGGDTLDPVSGLARETGASLVVNGSIYRDGDTLVFQAQLVDAGAGKLVGAVEPVRAPAAQPGAALPPVRARLMGLLALSRDPRVIYAEEPPVYAAYQAFSRGMDAYLQDDYRSALAAFQTAYSTDSTFVLPLLYGAFSYVNLHEYAIADSLLHVLKLQRERLAPYDQHWLDYQLAEIEGNDREALAAIRAAAEMAPASKATYNFAVRAIEARQPAVAESALRTLSPDLGPMRGWLGYWYVLTASLHAQAKYDEELTAARAAQRRFPDRPSAYLHQVRALAALGQLRELEKVWSAAAGPLSATPVETGNLALEAGSELEAHSDSSTARRWFSRAYDAYAVADTGETATEARWGRAMTAARLGRFEEAFRLGSSLASSSGATEYLGLVGAVAARLDRQDQADSLARRLEADTGKFTYGRPQFQAARIAAALGDREKANRLLIAARSRGYTWEVENHRDPFLRPLHGLPVMKELLGSHQ